MTLGVGIIGVNPDRGWAREAHVPAVQALDGLELVAVGSRRDDAAQRAADSLGARRGYGDAQALIDDPEVDVVGVAASVPAHRELIVAAARAGKHVYTEWPLAVRPEDGEAIAEAVEESGVRVAVGLQARAHPAVHALRSLLAGGELGRPLSVSVLSTTAGFGPVVPEGEWYLEDPATGMHLVTIQLAHTVDLVASIVGSWADLSAQLDVQFEALSVGERTETRTLADHALVQGHLDQVPATVEVAAGRPADDTPFDLTVVGERGTARLVGGAPRGFQAGDLELTVDGEVRDVPRGELAGLPPSVVNVAATWAVLRDDVTTGSHIVPDVAHAQSVERLVDAIRTSDREARRISGW